MVEQSDTRHRIAAFSTADGATRWVYNELGVEAGVSRPTGEVRDVFRVTDGYDDSCGWSTEWRRATGVDFAPFDSVVVTDPLLGRFRLSD